MGYKNLFLCDSVNDLSTILYEGAVAIIISDLSLIHYVEGGTWISKPIGSSPDSMYPLDSIFQSASEKDPADILGFGKWELVAKEPFFAWQRKG